MLRSISHEPTVSQSILKYQGQPVNTLSFNFHYRYYDTCTRQTLDPSNVMPYFWCANKLNTSVEVPYQSGTMGKCSGFLIPEDIGCPDHYHLVNKASLPRLEQFSSRERSKHCIFQAGTKCIRISTYPVTFDEAHTACLDEGAELLTIVQDQMTQRVQALLEQKRTEFEHYSNTDLFWVGAEYRNGWHWMDSQTNELEPFGSYTNWESNNQGTKEWIQLQIL